MPTPTPTQAAFIASCALLLFCLLLMRAKRWRRRRLPPGPRGWPVLGALPLIGPIVHAALAEMATRFGPTMYLKLGTSGAVILSTPSAARTFLKDNDLRFANRPPLVGFRIKAQWGPDLVFANYGPRWKLLRRLCTLHMLGGSALASWAHARRSEVGHLLSSVRACGQRSEPVVLPELLMRTVANVIGLAILSRRVFDEGGAGESQEFKRTVVELMAALGELNITDAVPLLAPLDLLGVGRRTRLLFERLHAILRRMLSQHAESAHQRAGKSGDLVDYVMASRDEAMPCILPLVFDLIIAGTETTSIAIQWAMAELLKNPRILKRLQAEVDEVVGTERRLGEADIPKLPFLQAVCKEALRMHPPTPLGVPHFSSEACEVDGYYIPKNTRVMVNIWAIGRDPEVWENPLEFYPERFLSEKGVKIEPYGADLELMPFGTGRRVCVGARMAVLVLQYVLGTLVHSFEWELPDGVELNMDEGPGISLTKAVPVSAMVRPRLVPTAYEFND